MLNLRYFPNAWKTAVVVPILKPGENPKLAESHRPISLLPVLSKLAEKIISARLYDFLKNENILIPEQQGSALVSPQPINYSESWSTLRKEIKEVNVQLQCSLTSRKLGRVWHTGLLFKLITYKIPPPLILLNSYISDRTFSVKINHTFSQVKSVKAGISQGSILGPTL
ncbi:RNA-directed DNA polymerase from mobile element jockey [Trichonephila clavipes]|nr:RNA-directed DNA polymerase from mobile element jockey [Trichonephila clavipes]